MRPADRAGWLPDGPDTSDTSAVGALPGRVPVGGTDIDADGDGAPDTVLVSSGDVLCLFTDLDGDMLADQRFRLDTASGEPAADDPDHIVPDDDPWWAALGDLLGAALRW